MSTLSLPLPACSQIIETGNWKLILEADSSDPLYAEALRSAIIGEYYDGLGLCSGDMMIEMLVQQIGGIRVARCAWEWLRKWGMADIEQIPVEPIDDKDKEANKEAPSGSSQDNLSDHAIHSRKIAETLMSWLTNADLLPLFERLDPHYTLLDWMPIHILERMANQAIKLQEQIDAKEHNTKSPKHHSSVRHKGVPRSTAQNLPILCSCKLALILGPNPELNKLPKGIETILYQVLHSHRFAKFIAQIPCVTNIHILALLSTHPAATLKIELHPLANVKTLLRDALTPDTLLLLAMHRMQHPKFESLLEKWPHSMSILGKQTAATYVNYMWCLSWMDTTDWGRNLLMNMCPKWRDTLEA